MKRAIFIICVMLLYTLSLFAQEEDYTTMKGDFIMIKDSSVTVGAKLAHPPQKLKYYYIVQELERGRKKMHSADSVSSFRMNGQLFVSMPSPIAGEDKNIFLQ